MGKPGKRSKLRCCWLGISERAGWSSTEEEEREVLGGRGGVSITPLQVGTNSESLLLPKEYLAVRAHCVFKTMEVGSPAMVRAKNTLSIYRPVMPCWHLL